MYKPLNKSLLFIFIGLLLSLFSFINITILDISIPVGTVASFVFILIGCSGLMDKFKWAKILFIIEIVTTCVSFLFGVAIGIFIGLNEELLEAYNNLSFQGVESIYDLDHYAYTIRNHASELYLVLGLPLLVDLVASLICDFTFYKLYCEVIDKVQVRYKKSRFKADLIWIVISQTLTIGFIYLQSACLIAALSQNISFSIHDNQIVATGEKESEDFFYLMNVLAMFALVLMIIFAIFAFIFIIRRIIASYKVYKEVKILETNGYHYGMVFENTSESILEPEKVQETSEDSQDSDESK